MVRTQECGGSEAGKRRGRIVIIGGGSAAFAAATAAAPLAASVTIVNKGLPMGGCCVNVGCVPSKFLIQAARFGAAYCVRPPYHGISEAADRVDNFTALTAQNRELTERLRREKYADVIAGLDNVQYVEGFGTLVRNEGQLAVAVRKHRSDGIVDQELPADRVILATGVHNSLPDGLAKDLSDVGYLTNEDAYFQTARPESLVVLGGGYVAVEAAQMFARLGSRVTLLQRSSTILSHLDDSIGTALAGYLEEEGIKVVSGCDVKTVTMSRDGQVLVTAEAGGRSHCFAASKLFVATGRRANTALVSDLPVQLAETPHGGFVVSPTLQTSVPDVYAAGDCVAGSPQYVYTAAAEGKLAALNALASLDGRTEEAMDYSVVPWVVFTSPAVAGVGLDVRSARARGIDADASTLPLSLLPRAIAQQDTRGFVTLVRNRSDDTIIGALVLAEDGGELVMEASFCVRYKVKVSDVAAMYHPYLTWNEAWKLAALGFAKNVKQLSCCAT
ncbi:mercuric reductase [Verruconis gallopava]|uniref:Mercuric reductase n=1 Tax=Verruconis gallopava TaxID=253628 RepID=A0A0D1XN65_9PEZI|nr:mercuric reductase [Verruconis gallopava]KIW04011.1 mercuric reductase [Verruconis gallopava]